MSPSLCRLSAATHERTLPPSILDSRLFQNTPEDLPFGRQSPIYMSGNANKNWPSNAMSESRPSASSEPGRPGTRGRPHSQASNPSRRQHLRQSFQAPIYPAPPASTSPESASAPVGSPPPFQSIAAASYQGAPLTAYGQRGPFVGQYTMSPPPPVSMP